MKIYISGKITDEDYAVAYLKFKTYETKLTKLGHDVVNPLNHIDHRATWVDAMKKAIMLMMDCDTIFQLPDWTQSPGAKIEFELAAKLSFQIFTEKDMYHLKVMNKLQNKQNA